MVGVVGVSVRASRSL